ncbi:MAG: glutaredoxin [Acidiferrobacterales bacterium]|nr:glutaredoxin [Acidiferrobacterales bacterium]
MTSDKPDLTLYVRDYCMYCNRVLRTADELGIRLEVRNIWQEPEFEKELVGATGRSTVPVLRIDQTDGTERWMPESSDIVRYLQTEISSTA